MIQSSLVADIGGTNIRFTLIKRGKETQFRLYPHDNKLTAEHAIQKYLDEVGVHPDQLIIGAAGALQKRGKIRLTNRRFVLDLPKLCKTFQFKKGLLTNDMALHALGVADLPDSDNACVIYVGTGLGCAYIHNGMIHSSEDGHTPIPDPDSVEKTLKAQVWEDMISGPSFLKIYNSLSGPRKPVIQSREVSYLAHNSKDHKAIQTYQIMAHSLGRFCKHIAQERKVSVFYLGGKIMEILRLPAAQEEFFNTIGRLGDIISFRQIRPEVHSALTGLKLLSHDLRTHGTTHRICPDDFYVFSEQKK